MRSGKCPRRLDTNKVCLFVCFCSHAFSRAWCRLHVFASNYDWFIALFMSVVIGQRLGLFLRHSIENCSIGKDRQTIKNCFFLIGWSREVTDEAQHGIYFLLTSRHYKAVMLSQTRIYLFFIAVKFFYWGK